MSEFSSERKERYVEKMLRPGERIWFVRLAGHLAKGQKARLAAFVAIARKVWKMAGKKNPWDLFRFGIERDLGNKVDDAAVSIFLWRKTDKGWIKHPLGFVPATERGKGKVNHNRAFAKWLDEGKIKKINYTVEPGSKETFKSHLIRLVHIHWDEKKTFGSAHFAIHTSFGVKTLPRGVKEIENVGLEATTGLHDGEIPTVANNDYPTEKTIDKLISAHKEFVEMFQLEEDEGILAPTFMSQWWEEGYDRGSFESQNEFACWLDQQQETPWTQPETTVDLRAIEKEHGPVMAENYYRFTGLFEGPFTKVHAARVLATITEMLMIARKFRAQSGS
jgi:hypothetical protein